MSPLLRFAQQQTVIKFTRATYFFTQHSPFQVYHHSYSTMTQTPSAPPPPRPVRSLNLTAKLKDSDNASTPELSFQRRAVQDFRARQAQVSAPASETGPRPALLARNSLSHSHTSLSTASTGTSQKRHAHSVSDNSGSEVDEPEQGMVSQTLNILSSLHYRSIVTATKRRATTSTVSACSSIVIDDDSVEVESEDSDKDICSTYFTLLIDTY